MDRQTAGFDSVLGKLNWFGQRRDFAIDSAAFAALL